MTLRSSPWLADDRPVLPWRWVAGGLLHFAILVYLLLVPLLCLVLAPANASAETIARLALWLSLWVLGGLLAAAMVALPAMALLDRAVRLRRGRRASGRGTPGADQAQESVERAIRTPLGDAAEPLLARIASARWDYAKPRHQAVARDLHEVVVAAATALASATPERHPAVTAAAIQALTRIADELDALAAARAAADEARIQMLSNYVCARYPALDSAFKPD